METDIKKKNSQNTIIWLYELMSFTTTCTQWKYLTTLPRPLLSVCGILFLASQCWYVVAYSIELYCNYYSEHFVHTFEDK